MAVTIPKNYPTGCSDKDISKILDELLHEYVTWGGDNNHGANIVAAGDVRFDSMISVGQQELQKRFLESSNKITNDLHKEIVSLKKITKTYSESSERIARSSRKLAITAIGIAVAAIIISVFLAWQSNHLNTQWQNKELEILHSINDNVKK